MVSIIHEHKTVHLDPYDKKHQACLIFPDKLCEPNASQYETTSIFRYAQLHHVLNL